MLGMRSWITRTAVAAVIALAAAPAGAVDIEVPTRGVQSDAEPPAAPELVAAWRGSGDAFLPASNWVLDREWRGRFFVQDGRLLLGPATPYGASLVEIPLVATQLDGMSGLTLDAFGPVLRTNDDWAELTKPLDDATAFEVSVSALNPIESTGDGVDRLAMGIVHAPEPSTAALLALGIAGLAFTARRRRQRSRASSVRAAADSGKSPSNSSARSS